MRLIHIFLIHRLLTHLLFNYRFFIEDCSISPALRSRYQQTSAEFFGGHSEEGPPVPIPNTEVKLFSADGTAWETMWESRSPPNSSSGPGLLYDARGLRCLYCIHPFCIFSGLLPSSSLSLLHWEILPPGCDVDRRSFFFALPGTTHCSLSLCQL